MRKKQNMALFILMVFIVNVFASSLVAVSNADTIENEMKSEIVTTEEVVNEEEIIENEDGVAKLSSDGELEVNTIQELKDAIANQTGDLEITLSDSFPLELSEQIEIIKENNFNLSIDGKGKELSPVSTFKGILFKISKNNGGELTLKNLKFNGKDVANDDFLLGANTSNDGKIIMDNVEFSHSTSGTLWIGSEGTYLVNNSKFHDNKTVNSGSIAITSVSTANITINKTVVKNNTSFGGGYEGGAVSAKEFKGNLDINNTLFEGNQNKVENTKVFGGGGGAMSIHYLYGKVNVKDSYFKGNKTNNEGGENQSTYDGGAIYVIDGKDGATFNIDGTTFEKNIAHDDGGAIMFQGSKGSPAFKTEIKNSTFFGNEAHGLDGAMFSGGAIQYFVSGGRAVMMDNTLTGNTFVNNEAGNEDSKINQTGGAIGDSGVSFFPATINYNNNLFLGNKVYDSEGKVNVSSTQKDFSRSVRANDEANNIVNVDKGIDADSKLKEILGTANPKLSTNFSNVKAGTDDENVVIPTLPVRPEGLADNSYKGTVKLTEDQRKFVRHSAQGDQGSIEMSWIKYNANGGEFGLTDLAEVDGTTYYQKNDENKYVDYYDVAYISKATTAKNGVSDLSITNGALSFKGWATTPDATVVEYNAGDALEFVEENTTLYAVWEDTSEYNVTYDANTGTGTQTDANNPYTNGSEVTVLDKGTIAKANHEFKGWNTKADKTGTAYQPGDKFNITKDTTLYAVWEENDKFTVTYDANTGTGTQTDANSPYYDGTEVTVLDKGTIVKANHEFKGWNTKADKTGTAYQPEDKFNITEDTTLYAVWEENDKFTVTYDANTGTGTQTDANSPYYDGSEVTVLDKGTIAKANHEFKGWNTKADKSGTAYQPNAKFNITEDTTLYAVWEENDKFTVTYDANTGTGTQTDANSPYYEGSEVTVLDKGNITKVNHEFMGWNTKADKSGVTYQPGDKFNITGDTTLYAIWKEDGKFAVTYNANTGTGTQTDANSPYYGGSEVTTLEKGGIEKQYYTFKGWNTKADKSGTAYQPGDKFNITEDITLYAIWSKNKDVTLVGGPDKLKPSIEEQLKDFKQQRFSGANRYETAVEVSKNYAKSDVVVLASGKKYTDELTATVLANKLGAPILLTRTDDIPDVVKDELERLQTKKVIVIGGPITISLNIEKELQNKFGKTNISRLGGGTRYETAVLVGNEIRKITGNKTDAILVDGTNFPDAIAMTSMAVERDMPILLTTPSLLHPTTEKAVKDWKVSKVTIGGGPGSVSAAIENKLKGKVSTVGRIAGQNRYETSVLVAKAIYPNPEHVVIASGEIYPDAIVAAPYAAKHKYPLLLSRSDDVPSEVMDYIRN